MFAKLAYTPPTCSASIWMLRRRSGTSSTAARYYDDGDDQRPPGGRGVPGRRGRLRGGNDRLPLAVRRGLARLLLPHRRHELADRHGLAAARAARRALLVRAAPLQRGHLPLRR